MVLLLIGYDLEQMQIVLDAMREVCKKPFGIKLPPYFNRRYIHQIAKIINKSTAEFVCCTNSLSNGRVIDSKTETTVIKANAGLGGMSGRVLQPIALANVRQFRKLLNKNIHIVGCGGITNGTDVFEYILAGADAVQIGTALQEEGVGIFSRLLAEFVQILQTKRYTSLADFKNKLKTMD